MDLQPEQAVLVKFDVSTEKEIGPEEVVSLSLLHPGDVVKIRPGCKIPADGVVISGRSSVDESMITGESVPVVKEKDSVAIGSTINQDGLLYVQIEHVGEDSMLFQIIRLVEDAQSHKAPIQDFADKVSAYFVPVIIGLALITFLIWVVLLETGADVVPRDWYPAGHGAGFLAISFGLSVLVISCPCALGLAVFGLRHVKGGAKTESCTTRRGGKGRTRCGDQSRAAAAWVNRSGFRLYFSWRGHSNRSGWGRRDGRSATCFGPGSPDARCAA